MDGFLTAWVIPLTFLPGVAALILSTSNRYFNVKNLIRSAVDKGKKEYALHLLRRCKFFHRALTFLYLSIGCFSIAALLGNLSNNWFPNLVALSYSTDALIFAGVSCVIFSSYQLIRESIFSFSMINALVDGTE